MFRIDDLRNSQIDLAEIVDWNYAARDVKATNVLKKKNQSKEILMT